MFIINWEKYLIMIYNLRILLLYGKIGENAVVTKRILAKVILFLCFSDFKLLIVSKINKNPCILIHIIIMNAIANFFKL